MRFENQDTIINYKYASSPGAARHICNLVPWRKKYTSGPRYWNVPVLMNTGTFRLYQYCPKIWYLRSLERAGGIQKQTVLDHQNGLVLSNTRVPVSETWSILFFPFDNHNDYLILGINLCLYLIINLSKGPISGSYHSVEIFFKQMWTKLF